jgi:hypothetical protein
MNQLPPVRRVVTGTNKSGHSYIVEDGPSPAILTLAVRPGYQNANLWRTYPGVAGEISADNITLQEGVLPPMGGTVLRVIDFPPTPADLEELRRQHAAVFETMFRDARHQPTNPRHAGMHITATVDYAIALQGEITAILEEDETVLKAGDILVQRGTNHAWANKTSSIARVAFVLVDARAAA